MSVISAMNLGVQGIHKGMNGLRQNAQQISSSNIHNDITSDSSDVDDIAEPLIDLKLNKLQVEMSAKVVQTASEMIGTMLDIKA